MFSFWGGGDEGIGGNDPFVLGLCPFFFGELGGGGAGRVVAAVPGGIPGEGGGVWVCLDIRNGAVGAMPIARFAP